MFGRKRDKSKEAANHSIYAEPVFIAGQNDYPTEVPHDLPCPACGFNRRALRADRPCPECGDQPGAVTDPDEIARHSVFNQADILPPENVPPADQREGYANWLAQRIDATPRAYGWLVVIAVAALGGIWAVIGAIFTGSGGTLGVVIAGPVTEEIMKVALIIMIIETRPYLFVSRTQILFAAIASGAGFAVIENVMYLNVYIDDPSQTLVYWRWTVCTALHIGCTVVASMGAMRMWRRAVTDRVVPRIGPAVPAVIAAAVIHGAYNAFAVIFELVANPF